MFADRIFVLLMALVILTLICAKGYKHMDLRPNVRLNASIPTRGDTVGPTYLTANLPLTRRGDDAIPAISIGARDATATGAVAT